MVWIVCLKANRAGEDSAVLIVLAGEPRRRLSLLPKKRGEAQLPEPRLPPLGAQVLPAQAVFTLIFRGLARSTLASTRRNTPSFMMASILP